MAVMTEAIKAGVLGGLVADAHSLGGHWLYGQDDLAKLPAKLDVFFDPLSRFHPKSKKAGDFTHIGDQAFWLLETAAQNKGKCVDQAEHMKAWALKMATYTGYKDHATKDTLANMEKGVSPAAAESLELSAVGRTAVAVLAAHESENAAVEAALDAIRTTHRSDNVSAAGDFFAKLFYRVVSGGVPTEVIKGWLAEQEDSWIKQKVAAGLASASADDSRTTSEIVKEFGQSCLVDGAVPSTVHLIVKYEGIGYFQALEANVRAGGDSAARGMVAGMILAAHHGSTCIPDGLVASLNKGPEVSAALAVF